MLERVDERNINNYIGRKYSSLTIIDWIPRTDKSKRLKVKCLCDCGNECIRIFKEIRSGHTTSCGCRINRNKEYYDSLIGQKFNNLTILEVLGSNNDNKRLVRCLCDCGNEHITTIKSLKGGHTKSCGCLQRKFARDRFIIDGRTEERLYIIYMNMKARCYNPNSSNYKRYGGRGISICDEWLNDYIAFKKWSLDNGYTDDLTIDRINVNGNYEPSNCRWATFETQANNKCNTIYLTYNDKTQSITDWANEIGLSRDCVYSRYYNGMDIEDILKPTLFKQKGEK